MELNFPHCVPYLDRFLNIYYVSAVFLFFRAGMLLQGGKMVHICGHSHATLFWKRAGAIKDGLTQSAKILVSCFFFTLDSKLNIICTIST